MYRRAIVVVATVAAVAVPTAAFAQTVDTSDQKDLEERIELVCARAPEIEARVQTVIDRINGDADTIGSNAWLEVAAAKAEKSGRDALAESLRARIGIRTERLDVLEARLGRLVAISLRCEATL